LNGLLSLFINHNYSANVLLDLSFRAKVGDFGLARAIGNDPQTHIKQSHTARIVGTSGYIAPEYYRGEISTKLDTFAFGVVLLEVLTGLPSYDANRGQDRTDLITHINKEMRKEKDFSIFLLIDKSAGDWPSPSFLKLFDISQKCLTLEVEDRPEMKQIYMLLDELAKNSYKLYAQQTGKHSKKS
jgi:interleukin-1 receptor-associated kinase 4